MEEGRREGTLPEEREMVNNQLLIYDAKVEKGRVLEEAIRTALNELGLPFMDYTNIYNGIEAFDEGSKRAPDFQVGNSIIEAKNWSCHRYIIDLNKALEEIESRAYHFKDHRRILIISEPRWTKSALKVIRLRWRIVTLGFTVTWGNIDKAIKRIKQALKGLLLPRHRGNRVCYSMLYYMIVKLFSYRLSHYGKLFTGLFKRDGALGDPPPKHSTNMNKRETTDEARNNLQGDPLPGTRTNQSIKTLNYKETSYRKPLNFLISKKLHYTLVARFSWLTSPFSGATILTRLQGSFFVNSPVWRNYDIRKPIRTNVKF